VQLVTTTDRVAILLYVAYHLALVAVRVGGNRQRRVEQYAELREEVRRELVAGGQMELA